MKKRVLAFILAAMMMTSALSPSCMAAEVSFSDTSGHWAENAITAVVEKGLFQGTSADRFSPDIGMNRGMFVTVLGRFAENLGYPITGTPYFSDVAPGAYYAPYVGWAALNGIVNGTSAASFSPNAPITREQMCALFIRFLNYISYPVPAGSRTEFADAAAISPYAADAVQQAAGLGLIQGMAQNGKLVFSPAAGATRAQVAAVLLRLTALEGIDKAPSAPAPQEPILPGGGGGGIPLPQAPAVDEEEARIASYLTVMVEKYDEMEYITTTQKIVQDCMKELMDCIKAALAERKQGTALTREYVRGKYGDTIQRIQDTYYSMDQTQKNQVKNAGLRMETTKNLRAVFDYFDINVEI